MSDDTEPGEVVVDDQGDRNPRWLQTRRTPCWGSWSHNGHADLLREAIDGQTGE